MYTKGRKYVAFFSPVILDNKNWIPDQIGDDGSEAGLSDYARLIRPTELSFLRKQESSVVLLTNEKKAKTLDSRLLTSGMTEGNYFYTKGNRNDS